jgi:hypothetical protein
LNLEYVQQQTIANKKRMEEKDSKHERLTSMRFAPLRPTQRRTGRTFCGPRRAGGDVSPCRIRELLDPPPYRVPHTELQRSEIGLCGHWQRVGALGEGIIHFAVRAAPFGERRLRPPRALGYMERLDENRRIVD